ncbi:MAG TPA: hypothetical protein PK443_04045 [bacterium]|nr:hypothetical protein [bacterium]
MGHLTFKPEDAQTVGQTPIANSHEPQQPTIKDCEELADIFKILKKWDEESENKLRTA